MGVKTLEAEYLPTAKNKMVADFYDRMGMTPLGDGRYTMDLATATLPPETAIVVSTK